MSLFEKALSSPWLMQPGHYSYECTAKQQDRPYNSRPSRTQQLVNPKLAPKIKEAAPPRPASEETYASIAFGSAFKRFLLTFLRRRKGGSPPEERIGHKRKADQRREFSRKRSRSISSDSSGSDSVLTISTRSSRSPSQSRLRRECSSSAASTRGARPQTGDRHLSAPKRSPLPRRRRPRSHSRSVSPGIGHRRREGDEVRGPGRHWSRSPRRNPRSHSANGDPQRNSGREDMDRQIKPRPSAPRQRSPSPYSKRLALTKAASGTM